MNPDDKKRIAQALAEIEAKQGCRILFAVESGSRAWGFASPDSDFDVRGVFVRPLDWYLQLKEDLPDTIVESLPGDLDVSLWDIKKALPQLSKSNASFLEWLGSPIIYRDDGMIATLNAMKANWFNPAHVAYHYASMFRKAMEARNSDGSLRIKKLCYALRASLCLRYTMAFEKMPPTPFAAVLEGVELSPDEREAVREVLAEKETALESDVLMPDARLDGLLADRYDAIASHPWRKQTSREANGNQLDALFRSCVQSEGGRRPAGFEVIVMCGLPGCGKTTFCRERLFPNYLYISLDRLRTRSAEAELFAFALRRRKSCVIDNTNINESERARYIAAAKEAGARVIAYWFKPDIKACLARNALRQGRERIPDCAIRDKASRFSAPLQTEGFDEIHSVTNSENGFIVEGRE